MVGVVDICNYCIKGNDLMGKGWMFSNCFEKSCFFVYINLMNEV